MKNIFNFKNMMILIVALVIILLLVLFVYKPPITYTYEDVCEVEIYYRNSDDTWDTITLDESNQKSVYNNIKHSLFARVDRFVDDDCGPDSAWILNIILKDNTKDSYYLWNRNEIVKNICDEDGYIKERIYIRDKKLIKDIESMIK